MSLLAAARSVVIYAAPHVDKQLSARVLAAYRRAGVQRLARIAQSAFADARRESAMRVVVVCDPLARWIQHTLDDMAGGAGADWRPNGQCAWISGESSFNAARNRLLAEDVLYFPAEQQAQAGAMLGEALLVDMPSAKLAAPEMLEVLQDWPADQLAAFYAEAREDLLLQLWVKQTWRRNARKVIAARDHAEALRRNAEGHVL